MLSIYVVLAIVGGGLLVLSMVSGAHDSGGHELSHADHGTEAAASIIGMVASLRFWTYFCAFFGVAGLLLSLLAGLGSGVVLGLSLFMGLSAGVIIASLARALNRSQSTSTVGQAELAGRSGEVLVEIAPGRPGKVRLDLGGELLDLPAIADGALALPAGARIVVLSFEGERALVTPEAALLDATPRGEEEHG